MDLGNHIITCLTITFFSQGYLTSAQNIKQKISPSHAFDMQVDTIKNWVDGQDQDKYCFGLIVESASIEPGIWPIDIS